MMGGAFVLIMFQILSVDSVTASSPPLQCGGEAECPSDHVSMIQKFIAVSRHDKRSSSEIKNVVLRLKKEHFWALSQQSVVVNSSGAHFDKISEKMMAALFGQKLKHLTAPKQAQLQRGISDAIRSNRTRTNEMLRALCWLDDLTKASGAPRQEDDALPTIGESSPKNNSLTFSFDINVLFDSLMNGKNDGQTKDPLSLPADKPPSEAEAEPEGKCEDFSGKWIQQEDRSDNSFGTKDKCEAYSAEGIQKGCSLTATSDDAWWGHSVSLHAKGNKVQVQMSACSNKVFEGTLSDDGNTLSFNDGCKWSKVPVSKHWTIITGSVLLVGLVGVVGAFAYIHQSSA